MENWNGGEGIPRFKITHPAAKDEEVLLETWNNTHEQLWPLVEPDEGAQAEPSGYGDSFTDEDLEPIPRYDLPFGIPDWHGVGPRSHRDGSTKIVWTAP